ncbi:U4/U6.U5 tri-snRNP-associated protein snu66 [Colletotrichum shisoi]|uniref:U4/U6.U5 tri-snRNP-associated protein snu66 n=1 Tax=Colletotrichum shisoi TaxID=2078593 RepID=A0A5Q4C394_9PEZI|nr:U4/U6.U5 tri-snRNP-associated protein snu66 [Colletotrichum shisoi]
MDAATIEETNRIRVSLGMKPLPVPGAAPTQSQRDNSASDDEDAPSTLESRSAQAYENYQKVRDAEAAKRKREERAAAAKREREAAQRHAILEGKSLGEAEDADVDAKAWLKAQKKRQKAIDKARKLEEEQAAAEAAVLAAVEYTSKDLAGVKVAHELDNFLDGDEQILTLKDATIDQNEEEGDELENMDLRAKEKLQENLDLKKKKPAYDVFAAADEGAERGILAQYDDEIYGKKGKKFTLDSSGAIAELGDILGAPEKSKKLQNIDLDAIQDAPTSDYLDISEIKVKKPKKKKSKSTRQKPIDEDDIFPIDTAPTGDDMMDLDSGAAVLQKKRKIEDDTFVDDEDLQASLAIQRKNALKKRKRARPEDIARQLREQVDEPGEAQTGGVVIDEISEFVSNLKKPEEEEERKPKRPKSMSVEPVTAMDAESGDEDHPMGDDDIHEALEDRTREDSADIAATGVDEEKTMNTGMGSTLALLRERGILKDARGAELNMSQRQKAEFLAEKRRIEREQEERTKSQRERDRNSGRLDAMSTRDREERARQANAHRELQQSRVVDELFKKHYKPKVELKYVDDHGRSLDQKEAFKHMSHQFHGKGSGKGKTDKLLKKIEEEKRREAKPTFDASENANMSSSSAKRQAGVRLQ